MRERPDDAVAGRAAVTDTLTSLETVDERAAPGALHASPKRQREMAVRTALAEARTVVVKVGSSSLTTNGRLNDEKIARVGTQVIAASRRGYRVILVSSGAILSG